MSYNLDASTSITQNQQVQGGTAAVGAGSTGNSAVSLSGGAGSTFSITQESPQAIAALQANTTAALQAIAQTAQGSLAIASDLAGSAIADVKNKSETATQQIGNILIPLGVAVAVVAAIYFYSRS